MANIRSGGFKGRNLVGTAMYYEGKTDKNGKKLSPFYVVDAQLDMRDQANNPATQSNPHLESHKYVKDGKEFVSHGISMTVGQMETIMNGAGADNMVQYDNGLIEFACKANLMTVTRSDGHKGLLINTKDGVQPSDFGWNKDMMKNQAALKAEAKANVKAMKEEQAAKSAENPTPEKSEVSKSNATIKPKPVEKATVQPEVPTADAEFDEM